MSGKVVEVITGAGAGLERAIAERLGADGETVILLGRTLAKVQGVADALGGSASAIECDVSDSESVRKAFEIITERHGKIDVLINNAAVFVPFLLEEGSAELIKSTIDTNLVGPILCSRAAIPLFRAAGGGLVISVSSESVELDMPWFSVYEASKTGLERFTRALRHELKPDNVRVTTLRIGSLIDPQKQWDVDPVIMGRFMQASVAAGFDLMRKKSSKLGTAAGIVRSLIDMPDDTGIDLVTLSGRQSGAG